jgi:hypothetical protein
MVLWVSWMLSAITLVWYMSAHIRFDIDAALGSSFSILAALLVDETLIRSTPFKFLSSHISHCPNACPSVAFPKRQNAEASHGTRQQIKQIQEPT